MAEDYQTAVEVVKALLPFAEDELERRLLDKQPEGGPTIETAVEQGRLFVRNHAAVSEALTALLECAAGVVLTGSCEKIEELRLSIDRLDDAFTKAPEAGPNEKEPKFLNHYECPSCGDRWTDEWSAQCEDDCPACGERHIEPFHSEDIAEDGEAV